VESQFAKGLPIIAGDRVQLQQVVLNLILNALQTMGAVSRQVIITTRRIELNDLYVGVSGYWPWGGSGDPLASRDAVFVDQDVSPKIPCGFSS